jgi:hypothetical protein
MGEKETLSTAARSEASGGAIAIGEEGLQRTAAEGGAIAIDEEGVQRAINLNSSKSNVARLAEESASAGNATEVKGSKSNTSERSAEAGPGEPGGANERTNLNSSKSNIYRAGGAAEGLAVDEPGVIDN